MIQTGFFSPVHHYTLSLQNVLNINLQHAALYASKSATHKLVPNKAAYIDAILYHFHQTCQYLTSLTTVEISTIVNKITSDLLPSQSRLTLICVYFKSIYGITVASALRMLPWPVNAKFPDASSDFLTHVPWLKHDIVIHMNRIPLKLPLTVIKTCLKGMHLSTQPIFKSSSKVSCWHAIVHHLWQRVLFLASLNDTDFFVQFFASKPFVQITDFSRYALVLDMVEYEYGSEILLEMSCPFISKPEYKKKLRLDKKWKL